MMRKQEQTQRQSPGEAEALQPNNYPVLPAVCPCRLLLPLPSAPAFAVCPLPTD